MLDAGLKLLGSAWRRGCCCITPYTAGITRPAGIAKASRKASWRLEKLARRGWTVFLEHDRRLRRQRSKQHSIEPLLLPGTLSFRELIDLTVQNATSTKQRRVVLSVAGETVPCAMATTTVVLDRDCIGRNYYYLQLCQRYAALPAQSCQLMYFFLCSAKLVLM